MNRSLSPAVRRYQQQRELTGPWHLEGCQGAGYRGAVVIPALGEGQQLWSTLDSLASNPAALLDRFLVVVVVNGRDDSAPQWLEQNERDLDELRAGRRFGELHLAWVDASTAKRRLPVKQGGVGMARKIGCDLVLPQLAEDSVLIHLDADTLVATNYLAAIVGFFSRRRCAAAVIPYCHRSAENAAQQAAVDRYELFLRCHVLGLKLAKSPYAYHSIGSTMVCSRQAYLKIGGMNCRQAGEDFYFLQQLTKVGGIGCVDGTVVQPSARCSQRTPFGTGQVVQRLSGEAGAEQKFYAPFCYNVVGDWLQLVTENLDQGAASLLSRAHLIQPLLAAFLEQQQFAARWAALCRTHHQPAPRLRAFHEWFDGLKTLRCIHYLSEHAVAVASAEQHVPALLRQANLDVGPSAQHWLAVLRHHSNSSAGA